MYELIEYFVKKRTLVSILKTVRLEIIQLVLNSFYVHCILNFNLFSFKVHEGARFNSCEVIKANGKYEADVKTHMASEHEN